MLLIGQLEIDNWGIGLLGNGDMAKKEEGEAEEKTIGSEDKKRRLALKVELLIGILL